MRDRYRKINWHVRALVNRHLNDCVHGTRINAKDLAHQFSGRDRVFLAGTISRLLQKRGNLRCDSVTDYVVV